ncbi:hypothetical protein J3E69DRAFT_336190 [Trichoderma sp. SZMC 28015]
MPKSSGPETYVLSKVGRKSLLQYLENANPNYISLTAWAVKWVASHGETRSASKHTYHIGFRFVQDHYQSCILAATVEGNMPIEGTLIDWGTSKPDPGEILEHYQNVFQVQPLHPLKRPEPRRDNDDEGRDGGGSSGRTWTKQVYRDDYGGYYYIGQDEEYHQCDAKGKDIQSTEKSTGYRTSNPYRIVLVFSNAQKQTYYQRQGQPELCSLRKHSSGTYYFVDYKGRECNAQYVGSQPRWMNRKAISQSTGGQGGYTQTSKPTFLTDPKTGRPYYIDKYGKACWA